MIGKMHSIFNKSKKVELTLFYAAIVSPKDRGPAIFAGYHDTLESAKAYVAKTYPNREMASYSKVYLTNEPSILEIMELGVL